MDDTYDEPNVQDFHALHIICVDIRSARDRHVVWDHPGALGALAEGQNPARTRAGVCWALSGVHGWCDWYAVVASVEDEVVPHKGDGGPSPFLIRRNTRRK